MIVPGALNEMEKRGKARDVEGFKYLICLSNVRVPRSGQAPLYLTHMSYHTRQGG